MKACDEDVGELQPCDVVCSYSVGDHELYVNAFGRTTRKLLRLDGVAVHVVDFSQHFDWSRYGDQFLFLSIPDRIWKWMGSHRGLPNRVRFGEFVEALHASGLQVWTVAKRLAAAIPDAGRMQPRFPRHADGIHPHGRSLRLSFAGRAEIGTSHVESAELALAAATAEQAVALPSSTTHKTPRPCSTPCAPNS